MSKGKPLTAWSITGNTVQNGTPTPENPVEVQGVGDYDSETGLYRIPVVTRGKNLIDVANLTGKTSTLFTDNINPKLAQVKFDEATQYTISMKFEIDTSIGWRKITFTYTDGTTSVSPWIFKSDVFKYTSTSGKTIAKVEFTNFNYYGDVYVEYIQLESGTEATEYSPYIEPITTPIYLDKPLYKIGDYADSINYAEQKVERRIKELVLTGEEMWSKSSAYKGSFYAQIVTGILSETYTAFCSHLAFSTLSRYAKGKFCFNGSKVKNCNLWLNQFDSSTTVDDFKAYLSEQYAAGTPVKVYYVLATPETETFTAPQIPTLNGTTVIDVDTAVKPENMTIKYRR